MSPSHVGYYFDNRGAILEYYSAQLCRQILEGLPSLDEPDIERLTDAIADFCFGEGQQNTSFLGVIQEITGLAVHDERLRQIKSEHSTAWRSYLEAFFERIPPAEGTSPADAARVVHATLVGLDTNSVFDPGLSREAAHEIFRGVLRRLAGLEDKSPVAAGASGSPEQRTITNAR